MFDSIEEVIDFYKKMKKDKNHIIYNEFNNNLKRYPIFFQHFNNTNGFGELPFSWNWFLILKDMPQEFKFLEIGVYKGRLLSLIKLISNMLNKKPNIYGITPLYNAGDKYSTYENDNYFVEIQNAFINNNLDLNNTTIINGFSQDKDVLEKAEKNGLYDIIFIDGSHDYEMVCQDIKNYIPFLKTKGYLVMDDSSLYIDNPGGDFKGHPDVGKAIIDVLDNDPRMNELYACGHNRVWIKISE
jgi:hypothetical protein